MKKLLKWVAIIIGGLIVLGLIANALTSPEEKAAAAAAREQKNAQQAAEQQAQVQQEAAAMPVITAADIAKAYNENTIAADQQFKGKKLKVTGTVTDINTNFMGEPYLTLRGGVNQFMEPQFAFDKNASAQLATVKKGAKVTLICVVKGDIAKTPMSKDCTLL